MDLMRIKAELDLMLTTGDIDWDDFTKIHVRSIAKDAVTKRAKDYSGRKALAASSMALSGLMSKDFQEVYRESRKNSEAMSYYNYMLESLGFEGIKILPPVPKLTSFFGGNASVTMYTPVVEVIASISEEMYFSTIDVTTLAILRGCSIKHYERLAEKALKNIGKALEIARNVITAMSCSVSVYDDEVYADMVKTMGMERSGEKVQVKLSIDKSIRDKLREIKGSKRIGDLIENIIMEWIMRGNTRRGSGKGPSDDDGTDKGDI